MYTVLYVPKLINTKMVLDQIITCSYAQNFTIILD